MPSEKSESAMMRRCKGIEVIVGAVTKIDAENRRVETEAGGFDFDALVIALGAETAPETMPGFAETAVSPYTLEGAVATRDAVEPSMMQAVATETAAKTPMAAWQSWGMNERVVIDPPFRGGATRVILGTVSEPTSCRFIIGPTSRRSASTIFFSSASAFRSSRLS